MEKDTENKVELDYEIDENYYAKQYEKLEKGTVELENLFEALYLAMESTVLYDQDCSFLLDIADVIREKFKNLPS